MEECACPLDNTSLNFLILSKIIMSFFQQYFRDFKGFRNNISHLVITDGSAGERRAGMDMFPHFFSTVKQNKLEPPPAGPRKSNFYDTFEKHTPNMFPPFFSTVKANKLESPVNDWVSHELRMIMMTEERWVLNDELSRRNDWYWLSFITIT